MLYKHKKTGSRVKKISELDGGECFMVEDQDGKVFHVYEQELTVDTRATTKVKTLQVKDKASKEEPREFPPDMRLNIYPNSGIKNCIKDKIATIKTLKLAKLIIIV